MYDTPSEYWVPTFVAATLQPPQTELKPKLGGLPWGFPADKWPRCSDCGKAMTLLAQLPHKDKVLEIDSEQDVLHVFHCEHDPGMCNSGVFDSGANAAFVIPRAELGEALTPNPDGVWQLPEAWIEGWEKRRLPQEVCAYADRWYDPELLSYLPESVFISQCADANRAGGIPSWTGNGPTGFPPPPYEFLAQFETHLWFDRPLPAVEGQYEMNHHEWKAKHPNAFWHLAESDGRYYSEWANFGSGGTGFLFINRSASPAQICWFWNS